MPAPTGVFNQSTNQSIKPPESLKKSRIEIIAILCNFGDFFAMCKNLTSIDNDALSFGLLLYILSTNHTKKVSRKNIEIWPF